MRRIRKQMSSWAASLLDVPQDVTMDLPRITMIGNRQLYIENHRGVIHFSEDMLKLGLVKGHLAIRGKDLTIRAILSEEVFLEGIIHAVQYMENEEG